MLALISEDNVNLVATTLSFQLIQRYVKSLGLRCVHSFEDDTFKMKRYDSLPGSSSHASHKILVSGLTVVQFKVKAADPLPENLSMF
jgi:hypothetical protein